MLLLTNFTAKCELVFALTQENTSLQRFYFKTNRKTSGFSKKWYYRYLKQPSVYEMAYCYVRITGDFERFQCFNFETSFLENKKLENWSAVFQLKVLLLKAQHFPTKLTCQRPMLRQMEWGIRKGPITMKADLPLTT